MIGGAEPVELTPALRRHRRRGPSTPAVRASLRPVERALAAEARARADAIARAADDDAGRTLGAARAEAARVLGQARAEGRRTAAHAAARDIAASRVEARGIVLGARRRAFEALRDAALGELVGRRDSEAVRSLIEHRRHLAHSLLGAGARTRNVGPGDLDVVAELGHRRVVMTARALVDRQIAAMGPDVERLWS